MKKTRNKKLKLIPLLIIKVILILGILSIYMSSQEESYTNTINLLSVSTNDEKEVTSKQLIPLSLTLKPGNGEVFVHSNGIIESDTQLSIRNAKATTCTLLSLDCDSYDFFYSFTQNNILLEGPSAGAAISILTAKTLAKENIPNDIGITGSLSSGGIIGIVGGTQEKIELTQDVGFKKIIIPYFSTYNETNSTTIEVVKVLDILEALKEFDSKLTLPDTKEIEKEEYTKLMKKLGDNLCIRSEELMDNINLINNNTVLEYLNTQAQTNINASSLADQRESYYSKGSFCFGANNNLKSIVELQKNYSLDNITTLLEKELTVIEDKIVDINSKKYKENIITLNDFYVWLIINDRISESRVFISNAIELISKNNETNKTQEISEQATIGFAYAQERLFTVGPWEEFITHQGESISFSKETLTNTCSILYNEVLLKSKVLEQYEISIFNEDISNLEESFSKPFSEPTCIYTSLELAGRIDTVISSIGMNQDSSEEFSSKLFTIAKTRLSLHEEDSFPLIPFIYFEYAEELSKQNNTNSALLYTNYALNFGNLELYLHKDETQNEVFKKSVKEISVHPGFILALLLILGFLR
jgi:uncharacterized protein